MVKWVLCTMVLAASSQGLGKFFSFVRASTQSAQWFGNNNGCQGLNSLAARAQRCWCQWSVPSISTLIVYTPVTPIHLLLVCCITKDCSFPISLRMRCVRSQNMECKDPLTDSRSWGTTPRHPQSRYSEQAATHVQVKHSSRLPDRE